MRRRIEKAWASGSRVTRVPLHRAGEASREEQASTGVWTRSVLPNRQDHRADPNANTTPGTPGIPGGAGEWATITGDYDDMSHDETTALRALSGRTIEMRRLTVASPFYDRLLDAGERLEAEGGQPVNRTQELARHLWQLRGETDFRLIDMAVGFVRNFSAMAEPAALLRILRQALPKRQTVYEWTEQGQRFLCWLEPTKPGCLAFTLAWEEIATGKTAVAPATFATQVSTFPVPATDEDIVAQFNQTLLVRAHGDDVPQGRTLQQAATAYASMVSVAHLVCGLIGSGILDVGADAVPDAVGHA